MTRNTIIEGRFHATAHSPDAIIKPIKPIKYIFFRPAVSPSFPHTGTNTAFAKIYAVEIHAASETLILKSPMIFGNARLTTVWSRRPKKVPNMTVPSTHQRALLCFVFISFSSATVNKFMVYKQ